VIARKKQIANSQRLNPMNQIEITDLLKEACFPARSCRVKKRKGGSSEYCL
jgi:hypothetical protein